MSRTATAIPPSPYFPPRNATPTMRHCATPMVTAAHFTHRSGHHHAGKRRTKNLPSSLAGLGPSSAKKAVTEALGLAYEEIPSPRTKQIQSHQGNQPTSPTESFASHATSAPAESYGVLSSEKSLASSIDDSPREQRDDEMDRSTPTPSMSTSGTVSFSTTPLPTPSNSRAPSLSQQEGVIADTSLSGLGLVFNGESPVVGVPLLNAPTASRASWVPNLGKMAKAVVNSGMSMGMSFAEKRSKKEGRNALPQQAESAFAPSQPLPKPPAEELHQFSEDEAMDRRREWAAAEQRRIAEFAVLCSQWPHSGYNIAKWGPNGAKHFYGPQSYSNPQYFASLMARQAELEYQMWTTSATFVPCRRVGVYRSPGRVGQSRNEAPSPRRASPSASSSTSSEDDLARTTAEIKAAMTSPLLPLDNEPIDRGSQLGLSFPSSLMSVRGSRSLSELGTLASSMQLNKDENKDETQMDVDSVISACACESQRDQDLVRTQSCGAKRPLTREGDEEDKRRKVDEAMVVEEAVDTGVMMPLKTYGRNPSFSASTPDLAQADSPAVFGHVVKTSDTHPIIISPFLPAELLPLLSAHLLMPSSSGTFSPTPLRLASSIDVPSVLLSFVPPSPNPGIVPSPVHSTFRQQQVAQQIGHAQNVGNLLLSSCPGKRLRMGGPVKGRGPVCRDLCTDLRRIRSEGVGCLVCCLDDAELELLGVPWDTYSQAAAANGLDIVRVPMPDGFTPVSVSLFDAQIDLIATRYSLHGTNVLTHCRGGVGRAGLTACAWAIKMGFVPPHPSLAIVEQAAIRQGSEIPAEVEHRIVMSIVERVIAMIRSRRGLKAIESFEQVQFLASYVRWLRAGVRAV